MIQPMISRHELARRRAQLDDLHRYLQEQEASFAELHAQVQAFIARYLRQLESLYLELDALESQLHQTTQGLSEALRRQGIAVGIPCPPRATPMPALAALPAPPPWPAEPQGDASIATPPPSLKQLYRRAAMRLHPDLAPSGPERLRREELMRHANEAYAAGNRQWLEQLLLGAGEDPVKVSGSQGHAVFDWLRRSELAVQARLRVVQAHQLALQAHPMHQLWQAISRAEAQGLDPLVVMASRLRSQIAERRQEVYIGQRLQPQSELAQAFVHRRVERMGALA